MIALVLLASAVPRPVLGDVMLGSNTRIRFATVDEARALISTRDDFVERLSPFDRAARVKTDREVSESEFLGFVRTNVLAWDEGDKAKLGQVAADLGPRLAALSLPLPKQVDLVKTTGAEEGGAEYTRGKAIYYPRAGLASPPDKMRRVVCHELFHILSRANPGLREALYGAIGFERCDEAAFPAGLRARKLTNPDAPLNNHCVPLRAGTHECWGVPILFSRSERYDLGRGGEFFDYLEFRFLLVDRIKDSPAIHPLLEGGEPRLARLEEVSGFFERVGRNTHYVLHPEEILADNFVLLVMQEQHPRSPEILEKMRILLTHERTPGARP
jgi:hypothetical protein